MQVEEGFEVLRHLVLSWKVAISDIKDIFTFVNLTTWQLLSQVR